MNEILFEVVISGEVTELREEAINRAREMFGTLDIEVSGSPEDEYETITIKKNIHARNALQAAGKVANMTEGIFYYTTWVTAALTCTPVAQEATGVQ